MDLPKIKNEELPEELREVLGDDDAEFELIVDPMDVVTNIQIDPDTYYEQKLKLQEKLIESRRKANEYAEKARLEKKKEV
tara:strand:- start:35 stop:274 length:240 start_codon:yes stop_codon:yes gene_type:complete